MATFVAVAVGAGLVSSWVFHEVVRVFALLAGVTREL